MSHIYIYVIYISYIYHIYICIIYMCIIYIYNIYIYTVGIVIIHDIWDRYMPDHTVDPSQHESQHPGTEHRSIRNQIKCL